MIHNFHILSLSLMLLVSFTAEAKLSDKEKLAAATVLAVKTADTTKKEETIEAETPENEQEKLATIDVTGVDSELKKNIELHMPVSIPVCNAERGAIKHFFNTVKKRLRKASRALGYYDSEFVSGGKIVDGCWKLRLRITPGKATKVISQTVKVIGEGRNEALFLKVLKNRPYEKGDVLNHQKYSDFKTQLSEAAQSLGYFDAEFEQHSIKVNPLAHQATVALVLNTHTRYRYGKVTVDQEILSDKIITEFITLKTGQPYDTEALLEQQQFLQGSGYFKLIKIDVLHDQIKNKRVPIHITLVRKKRNNYKFKLGYGSDTGARVSAEMKRRWTGSKGKQLLAKAQYAENLSGISLQLTEPQKNPDDDVTVYDVDWKIDKNDDVISRSISIGGNYKRKNSRDWVQTASIKMLLDRTKVEGQDEIKSKYLLFGVGLGKIKADNLVFPTKGWRLQYDLRGATDGLLSDQNVLQFEATGKYIQPLGEGRLVSRLQLGTTIVKHFNDLPKSLRFFSGGGSTVRGYTFESLGTRNSDEKVIGGKQLLNLSFEYQHPIADGWSAAVFVDAGNAFDKWNNPQLKTGVGFGARWKSPAGPIRIDIGFPTDDYRSPHLHLSIGSDL